MKKLILLCVLIGQLSVAQISNYKFNSFNGTYTPLSNGTVWQSGAQLNSDASTLISLPKLFTIGGDTYSEVRVYSNGFITFGNGLNNGQLMPENVKYPISNTVKGWAIDYVVSAFGGNLCASSFGSPQISYGLNPNNDFTIQFQDLSIVSSVQSRVTFQIILKGDVIEFVYGDNNKGQFNVISPQIGLRGKSVLSDTNDAIGTKIYTYPDWQTRKVANGSNWNVLEQNPNYPNNVKGVSNSVTCSWNNTAKLPNSGLTFQWKP